MEAEFNHRSHATRECKYHVVFPPSKFAYVIGQDSKVDRCLVTLGATQGNMVAVTKGIGENSAKSRVPSKVAQAFCFTSSAHFQTSWFIGSIHQLASEEGPSGQE